MRNTVLDGFIDRNSSGENAIMEAPVYNNNDSLSASLSLW
jgi:hypothetical protein